MIKPGMVISNRYEIVDNVGSGGMADVYKAKDLRLNRFIAMKVLKSEYSSDKSFVNKFRGEAQSAAGLSHPNIVNVYDVGDDSGLHYIVMELVEGITLKRFIERKGKLEIKEAVGIAIQIAQGMEAAHDNHIIHRDIKPQNIIISKDGKVKVTDFGIAKATNSNTITSNAMGSVHYLSPEQARGGYSDEKSDIYSLGVTLYEMLSGKVPFAGDNTVSVALLHIQGEAMNLRELDPTIPISIDKIVQKCMQKRSERRYHSASELITDLKKSIANPDGDFVVIPAYVANDSPTINISDDLSKIKNGVLLDESNDMSDTQNRLMDDDEELDAVDPKVDKFVAIGSIAAIVVLAIFIIGLVIWFLFPKDKGNDEGEIPNHVITVTPTPEITQTPTTGAEPITGTYKFPDVLGYTKEDADKLITTMDPDAFIQYKEEFSNDYKEGRVMSQYPEGDRDKAYGSDIIITISTGPESFTIPYVYNLTAEQAETKLGGYDLKTIRDYAYSDTVAKDKVIETDPPKDSLVVAGDTIKIILSLGSEVTDATVPPLLGSTVEQAKISLTAVGLQLGNVSKEASSTYEEGQIIYQSTTANQKVDKGSSIDVIVSTGPEVTEPGDGGTETGDVRYFGSVTINENPLRTMGDGESEVIFEMVQGEWQSTLFPEPVMLSVTDFPYQIEDIEGESDEPGYITIYVDGVPFVKPGESSPYVVTIYFEAVEE